jgi:regulator of sigma E protease
MLESLDSIWRIAEVVLGIGLVIFAHESGHFVAARLCKVRVEIFSLGFGPRLFGFRRGGTLYQVALVPLGGFVKMAGDEVGEGHVPAPDELGAKSVGQRFFIYSGGVLANVLFALVVFPVLFLVGVPFSEPVLGEPEPGSPAWRAELPAGTRVLTVNGHKIYDFGHIPTEVALGSPHEAVLEVVLPPGAAEDGATQDARAEADTTAGGPRDGARRTLRLVPEYSEEDGLYTIGVTPAHDAQARIAVAPDSPAQRAGLRTGDRLLGVVGALPGLPLEEQLYLATRDLGAFTGRFERDGETFTATLEPERLAPAGNKVLGVAPAVDLVVGVRETPLTRGLDLHPGDRLLAVCGRPILRHGDLVEALAAESGPFTALVDRGGVQVDVTGPDCGPADAVRLADDIALAKDLESGRVVVVSPDTAAWRAGLRNGDVIEAIDGRKVEGFDGLKDLVDSSAEGDRLELSVLRPPPPGDPDGAGETLALTAELAPVGLPTYGMGLQPALYVFRTQGPLEAVRIGAAASYKFMNEAWLALKRILLGQVRLKNVGGIVTIGVASHRFAELGLAKLFFFLCMLSMNLAFLNVLPIPVLDGGHLFFLLVEKVKGSPVSERVLGYSQIVGLVLIVSLMVYVTFQDLKKWVFPH